MTVAALVPPIVVEMAKSDAVDRYDLSSVRLVISGAAPMGKELQDTLRAKLPNAKLGQVRLHAFICTSVLLQISLVLSYPIHLIWFRGLEMRRWVGYLTLLKYVPFRKENK